MFKTLAEIVEIVQLLEGGQLMDVLHHYALLNILKI